MPPRITPKVGQTHDITLASSDGTLTRGFMLLRQQDVAGHVTKSWAEGRIPSLSPKQQVGVPVYTDKSPEDDAVITINDWSDGFGQFTHDYRDPFRYNQADSVDARWRGQLALGESISFTDFLARNLDAEDTTTSMWTTAHLTGSGSTITLSRDTTTFRSGVASWRVKRTTGGGANNVWAYQSLANPTIYRSREITVSGYARAGEAGTSAGVTIWDDVSGATTGATTNTTFTYVSATATINAAATAVRIGVSVTGTDGVDRNAYGDDMYIVPTGGVVSAGARTYNGNLYAAIGRCVCQWDATNSKWDAVYIHASTSTTSLEQFGANIFVAFGSTTAYIYGATTSWTVSNLAGNDLYAQYFARVRNVLWKSRGNNEIGSNASGLNGGGAYTTYTVGDSAIVATPTAITGLFSYKDRLYVGRVDGLWGYLRFYEDGTAADLFQDLTPEFVQSPSTDNFSRGVAFSDELLLATGSQGLLAFQHLQPTNATIQNISDVLLAPKISVFGGRVRAFAQDVHQVYLVVDTPTADTSTSKQTWLMSMRWREDVDGGIRRKVHTMKLLNIGDINTALVDSGYLYIFGRLYESGGAQYKAGLYRLTLPSKTVNPSRDVTLAVATSGTFITPYYDFNFPDTIKSFRSFTAELEGMSSTEKITVDFEVDGDTTYTTLGTLNSGTQQILYFSSVAVAKRSGRRIRFRFTFASSAATLTPVLHNFTLHANLDQSRDKLFILDVAVGDAVMLLDGSVEGDTRNAYLTDINTLEGDDWYLTMVEDEDQDGSTTSHSVRIKDLQFQNRTTLSETGATVDVYRLLLHKLTTS